MSDSEDTPLTKPKQKRVHTMTPAREAAIKKMVEKRKEINDIKRAKKILEAQETMKKYENKAQEQPIDDVDDEPQQEEEQVIIKKAPKKAPKKKIVYESESEEEEIVVVKKKKPAPKKKVVYLSESEEEQEEEHVPIQKDRPLVSKQSTKKPISVGNKPAPNQKPTTQTNYSSFFC